MSLSLPTQVRLTLFGLLAAVAVHAAPVLYTISSDHTYPSFEAPHLGLSFWRGKFDKTSGTIILDMDNHTGKVDITVDTTSVDFGFAPMNESAKSDRLFNVASYPNATYKSDSITFKDGKPAMINGDLTLLGVTKRVPLNITYFKCMVHPMFKVDYCGADAHAEFHRKDFGMGFSTEAGDDVRLAIQIEAVKGAGMPPGRMPPGGMPPAGPPPPSGAPPSQGSK